MGLFEVRGKSDEDPGTRYFIGNAVVTKKVGGKKVEEQVPCYVWVRRIPGDIAERLEREVPGKMKKPKFGGAPYRYRTQAEQDELTHRRLAWAVTKIEGPIATPVDQEAVEMFSTALGKSVTKGVPLNLNGELNEETKKLLFRRIPTLAGIVWDKLAELNHLYDEEEEAEARNLSTGSSGESPRSSQE